MKKLMTVCNVVEIAALLKDVSLTDVQAENQQSAQNLMDSFKQALHEFRQPIPNKSSQIECFEKHIKDLIATTQAVFDSLDEKIQQKIIKKVKVKNLDEVDA